MKRIYSIMLLMVIVVLTTGYANGQVKVNADSLQISQLTKDLSIDNKKAVMLVEAMQINKSEIDVLLKNNSIKPAEKQQQFIKLTKEREDKVNALLTPAEQERLRFAIQNKFGAKRELFRRQMGIKFKQNQLQDSAGNMNSHKKISN